MKDIMIGARIKDPELIEKIKNSHLSNTELINKALSLYFFYGDVCKHQVNGKNSSPEGSTKEDQKLAVIHAFIQGLECD